MARDRTLQETYQDLPHVLQNIVQEYSVMTREEFIELYSAGERNFSNIVFEDNINFTGLELNRTDFSNATLRGAIFAPAEDHAADYLSTVVFRGAHLENARFEQIDGGDEGPDFSGAHLEYARFNTIEGGVNFSGAHLNNARFYLCVLPGISFINFFRAHLNNVIFRSCLLPGASFDEANIAGSTFKDCSLCGNGEINGASFKGTTVTGATFLNTEWRMPLEKDEEKEADSRHFDAIFANVIGQIARWEGSGAFSYSPPGLQIASYPDEGKAIHQTTVESTMPSGLLTQGHFAKKRKNHKDSNNPEDTANKRGKKEGSDETGNHNQNPTV